MAPSTLATPKTAAATTATTPTTAIAATTTATTRYNERPTQSVASEPTGDGSHGGDAAFLEHASAEAGEPPTGGPDVDDDPGFSDPEDPDSDSYDPNAGFPVPRDQYYDFADPPYYGEEPEEPKPDPNALSKWELKAMEKGTLVWDSPGYPSIDSTTPGRY